MPAGTSSAIPDHLATLGATASEGGARLARAVGPLAEAVLRLQRSASTGVPAAALAALPHALASHALRTTAWADQVSDVAVAFALAGAGTTVPGSVGVAVTAGDAALARLLSLPGGRARTAAELEAMSPRRLRSWYAALVALDGFEDPNFRAVAGLLDAAVEGTDRMGPFSIFADPAFDVADATVLATMQDGWLAWHGVAVPDAAGPSAPARRAAVEGWVRYFEAGAAGGERGDELWAMAEEGSVRAGHEVVEERGLAYGPGMMTLVPFTHSFRYAVATDREGDLARSVLGTVDLQPLLDRAGTVAGQWIARAGAALEADARAGLEPMLDRLPGAVEWLAPPLRLAVGTVSEGALVAGAAVDVALDLVPTELDGNDAGELLDRVGLGDDLDVLAELVVDPSATPPVVVRRFLDDVIGHPAPAADATGAYYLARLADLGYLPGLGDGRPFPGAVPSIPSG